ncbi:MAG: sulfotransferase family protein, partial [Flavobacteriales bacterium]|nr:sulfotransferase family protein [Flavobacteriales bacterium]
MKRISMWSGPRNVSTAIMYAFHHRGDCHVIDEPFYAHYLKTTGLDHPGRDRTLEVHESNAEMVITSLVDGQYDKDFLFMKNMPHHMVDIDLSFITAFDNFFLIREPRAMISSYIKKIPDVSMSDLGLDVQFDMYDMLIKQGHR